MTDERDFRRICEAVRHARHLLTAPQFTAIAENEDQGGDPSLGKRENLSPPHWNVRDGAGLEGCRREFQRTRARGGAITGDGRVHHARDPIGKYEPAYNNDRRTDCCRIGA
jgi:hypothetical protein